MTAPKGIPDHVIEQVQRTMGTGPGEPSTRSVNRLTHELRRLNGNLQRLIELEERRLEMAKEKAEEGTSGG